MPILVLTGKEGGGEVVPGVSAALKVVVSTLFSVELYLSRVLLKGAEAAGKNTLSDGDEGCAAAFCALSSVVGSCVSALLGELTGLGETSDFISS